MDQLYTVVENNPHFLIINKNPGIGFHNEENAPGLFSRLKADFAPGQLFAVHRLDKVTSGLLAVAKDKQTASLLSGLFSRGEVEKFYLALAAKRPRKMKGIVEGDMVKGRRGSWRLKNSRENPAITGYSVRCIGDNSYLFLCRPKTGRTHQIRVALKSLGSPIAGDRLYSGAASAAGFDRTYLHSYALRFFLENKLYEYVCPPREGILFEEAAFIQALEKIKTPWDIL